MQDGDASDARTLSGVTKRKRARSAPPPPVRSPAPGDTEVTDETRSDQLDDLFSWLDDQRWSFSTLFTALSEVSSSSGPASSPSASAVALSHRRRMEDFLSLDEPLFSSAASAGDGSSLPDNADLGLRLLREARKKWSERATGGDGAVVEKGPNEVVRMWEELGALGRGEGSMVSAYMSYPTPLLPTLWTC